LTSYPLHLQLADRPCLVVGGGKVGRRKVAELLTCGARVTLVSTEIPQDLPHGEIQLRQRPFSEPDLDGMLLAFAATNDPQVNSAVVAAARERGVLVCRVDAPEEGDFSLPARRRQGGICLSIATEGRSPALASLLADRLAEQLSPEWSTILDLAAALREQHLTPGSHAQYNQQVLQKMIADGLPLLITTADTAALDRLLQHHCGPDCRLSNLGIDLPKAE